MPLIPGSEVAGVREDTGEREAAATMETVVKESATSVTPGGLHAPSPLVARTRKRYVPGSRLV